MVESSGCQLLVAEPPAHWLSAVRKRAVSSVPACSSEMTHGKLPKVFTLSSTQPRWMRATFASLTASWASCGSAGCSHSARAHVARCKSDASSAMVA